jgi:hypothetical protein
MSGVLASVAFLGIIFLLERRRRAPTPGDSAVDRGLENVAISLISAFLTLVIATFLYSALSGEDLLAPRAGTLALIAAIALSVAFLMLTYGVAWLFETWELGSPAAVMRVIAALIAPAVTFAFIGIRALDMLALAEGKRAARSWFGLLLLVLLLALIGIFFGSGGWLRDQARARRFRSTTAVRSVAYVALAVGVATVAATGVVAQLRVSFALARWDVAAVMSAVAVLYGVYILLVRAILLD